jgi:hypothetical protein
MSTSASITSIELCRIKARIASLEEEYTELESFQKKTDKEWNDMQIRMEECNKRHFSMGKDHRQCHYCYSCASISHSCLDEDYEFTDKMEAIRDELNDLQQQLVPVQEIADHRNVSEPFTSIAAGSVINRYLYGLSDAEKFEAQFQER